VGLLTFLLVIYSMSLANLSPVSKRNMDRRVFVQCAMCTAVAWSHPQKAYFGRRRALKVPKREIFDRSDFPDFYTIKSSSVGDLLVKF
jgi:hypothetical protein